jgi:hypothetical protein
MVAPSLEEDAQENHFRLEEFDGVVRQMAVDLGEGTVQLKETQILWKRGEEETMFRGAGFTKTGTIRSENITTFHQRSLAWLAEHGFIEDTLNGRTGTPLWDFVRVRKEDIACNVLLQHRDAKSESEVTVQCAQLPEEPIRTSVDERFSVTIKSNADTQWQPVYDEQMLLFENSVFTPLADAPDDTDGEYVFSFLATQAGGTEIVLTPLVADATQHTATERKFHAEIQD